jgi:hypothetical protein
MSLAGLVRNRKKKKEKKKGETLANGGVSNGIQTATPV